MARSFMEEDDHCEFQYFLLLVIDLFADTAAILISIACFERHYGMLQMDN